MSNITSLIKSVNTLSKNLGEDFTTTLDIFKGGKWFTSYVQMEVNRGDDWGCYTFYANGVDMIGNRKYSGESFKEMKKNFLNDFKTDFQMDS